MVKLHEIIKHIESFAPPCLQESYDNSGLQVGFQHSEISKALICLDITEEIIDEAINKGCELVISHHPLLFKGLKTVSDVTYQQRCVVKAIKAGIAVYSAHTSLDNAPEGVNYKIAQIIGLSDLSPLVPSSDALSGSGLIGRLKEPMPDSDFLILLKEKFGVKSLRHSQLNSSKIRTVALCGGAGAFLLPNAISQGADCFISGEFSYHSYFENDGVLLAELGHYQSEKFTIELLSNRLKNKWSEKLTILQTEIDTNPIHYL